MSAFLELEGLLEVCDAIGLGQDEVDLRTWPSDMDISAVLAARDRLMGFCDFSSAGFSHRDYWAQLRDIELSLGARGEHIALMRAAMDPFSAQSMSEGQRDALIARAWDAVRDSDEPWVAQASLEFLLSLGPGAVPRQIAPQIRQFDRDPALAGTGPERRAAIRALAADWIACELGAPCGAYGGLQERHCVSTGNCASHLGVQEYIRQRLLTPPEYGAMVRLVRGIQNAIRAEAEGRG
ncbi:hypothetical protein [Aquimonas voraii]|nr:hypothetical protein [Aquimonas voraii]